MIYNVLSEGFQELTDTVFTQKVKFCQKVIRALL